MKLSKLLYKSEMQIQYEEMLESVEMLPWQIRKRKRNPVSIEKICFGDGCCGRIEFTVDPSLRE